MPWVGLMYVTVQEMWLGSAPGGQSVYRVLSTCGVCNSKFEFVISPGGREHDLQTAFDSLHAHIAGHIVPSAG